MLVLSVKPKETINSFLVKIIKGCLAFFVSTYVLLLVTLTW